MLEMFLQNQPQLMMLVTVVLCLNILLSAVKQILEKVKDLTTTDADNKAYELVSKVLGWLSGAADWLSANVEHKKDK